MYDCKHIILILCSSSMLLGDPTSVPHSALEPAASPGDAFRRFATAVVLGDEEEYYKIVKLESPTGYSKAYAEMIFAEAQLKNEISKQRGGDDGEIKKKVFDAEKIANGIEWAVNGNVATANNMPKVNFGTQGKMEVRKIEKGWIVLVSDPLNNLPPDSFVEIAMSWDRRAKAIKRTLSRVQQTGSVKNVEIILKEEFARP